jgi:hypothetical protein
MRPLRLAHPGSATSPRLSLRTAREALAATALAGIVGVCFLLSAGAASGSSLFVHASHDTSAADFDYPHQLEVICLAAFVVLAVVLFVLAARDGRWASNLGWATLVLLLSVSWLMPWYVTWLLPFAAVGESRRLREATLLLTLFVIIVRMPYGAST